MGPPIAQELVAPGFLRRRRYTDSSYVAVLMLESRFYPTLADRVRGQKVLQPGLYGDVDFDVQPHRLATAPADRSSLRARFASRAAILADARLVELIRTTTMLGDVVADPYASLMAARSFKGLVEMLERACRRGLGAVPDAPPELAAFLAAMEARPAWLDMDLVREGARLARLPEALVSPFVVRGVFVATFMNTYAALPMALTGALGGDQAARRVKETSSFFAVTTLPGALERHGPGFEAAAKVRLMHSMVRYHALKRSGRWDVGVYGIPIPQVDQMPAGLVQAYILARGARRKGRSEWTAQERAVVEFGRYRCFLLGLPEELLPTTPQGILDTMHARAALLRADFDDATCGELVRATLAARVRDGETRFDRAAEAFERSCSKAAFIFTLLGGDWRAARKMGVSFGAGDAARVALAAPLLIGRFATARAATTVPMLRPLADAYATWKIERRLARYGKAAFTTDASTYAREAGPDHRRAGSMAT